LILLQVLKVFGLENYKEKMVVWGKVIISCLSNVLLVERPVSSLFFSYLFRVAVSYAARALQLSLLF